LVGSGGQNCWWARSTASPLGRAYRVHWICLGRPDQPQLPEREPPLCRAMADCTRTRRIVQPMRDTPPGQSQPSNPPQTFTFPGRWDALHPSQRHLPRQSFPTHPNSAHLITPGNAIVTLGPTNSHQLISQGRASWLRHPCHTAPHRPSAGLAGELDGRCATASTTSDEKPRNGEHCQWRGPHAGGSGGSPPGLE